MISPLSLEKQNKLILPKSFSNQDRIETDLDLLTLVDAILESGQSIKLIVVTKDRSMLEGYVRIIDQHVLDNFFKGIKNQQGKSVYAIYTDQWV